MSLIHDINKCNQCDISKHIKNKVIMRGSKNPKYLFIGEAPGKNEDEKGLPFVGRSGKILDKWIKYTKIKEEDYTIINIIKCRPPNNRNPTEKEICNCEKFFQRQLNEMKPEVIICVGSFAMKKLLPNINGLLRNAGKMFNYIKYNIYIIPHPAYYLRNRNMNWQQYLNNLKTYEQGREEI